MGACVAVMAGGTGGHVFPALAVAERLRAADASVFWIGTAAGLEARLVPARGLTLEAIQVQGVRGKSWWQRARSPLMFARAVREALGILRRRRPQVVLGMGGFVAAPGGLAARLLGIPLVIHEQNSRPGLTNRWLARIADQVCEAFAGSFPTGRAALATGNPVRDTILNLPPPEVRWAARGGPARLLVLGGSLGAAALNECVPRALAALDPSQRPLVRHQAGERTLELAAAAYRQCGIDAEVTAFIDDMAEAYAWADLAICRAGALTVAELTAAGLGAILVPYPFAVDDHQTGNARHLVAAGAGHLIPQPDLDPERLAERLAPLLADRARLLAMAVAARGRAQPEAAARIAARCLELARP